MSTRALLTLTRGCSPWWLQPAPAVALPDQKGATWTLSQHLPAAVVFYRGHW